MNNTTLSVIKLTFLGLFLSLFNIACAQTKVDKIDELLKKYAEYGYFNGSVLVADKGEVIYKKGFGYANVELEIPNKPDTKHRLASISKQFTAMLIVQLAAENKLKLDVPISTYLPDYPKKTADVVTIHHLLTHTSGIPNYTSFPSFREKMGVPHKPEDLVNIFKDTDLEFTPGQRFSYSNSGYVLLGYLIEKITGKTYGEVLQAKIFGPLNMNNSGYYPNNMIVKNRASGYERAGMSFHNAPYLDMSFPFSAGAIYSTVEDLYLWDQALYTEKLVSKKFLDLIFTRHIASEPQNFYGYGWKIGNMFIGNSTEQLPAISHSGGINGFNTLITRFPGDKSLVVLLNNTSGAPLDEMTAAINGILHNEPYDLPKKSIAFTLVEMIEKDGLDKTIAYYNQLKERTDFQLNENDINITGYRLLNTNKVKEAAFLFKINTEAYPNSYNVYDSYGEALMVLGEKEKAIENYKKSVELNPGNDNGFNKLKELGAESDKQRFIIPLENLKLLEGEYLVSGPQAERDKNWKIIFKLENGELKGNDRGYKYRLIPIAENSFINPDDGASLVFNTNDKNAISLLLFGSVKFNKL